MFDLWFPRIVSAAADLTPLKQFILKVEVKILNPIIQLGFAIALVVFLYGVFEFIKDAENPAARKTGGQHILWGILGMFIMIAAGGIMKLVCGSWGPAAFPDPSVCNPF